jgi:hypothetical protein
MKTPPTNAICSVDPIGAQVIELPSHFPICQMLWPTDERTEKETFANAEFIADAFTVFHETGLTTRQILEQRDEIARLAATYIAEVQDFSCLSEKLRDLIVIAKTNGAARLIA